MTPDGIEELVDEAVTWARSPEGRVRVVLDTNVFFSLLITPSGPPFIVIDARGSTSRSN